ncbi:LA2681 family HEPN domain-containing protein [Aeromicrobium sp. 9AM]|uniref:LA2681 family HEPN domain-containing protein n=1 Tax=Aeromicrobium sp. 9AM TaxID=2653126 RepID=UPI0012EF7F48|nr:LA2681 family HEPN domain-containing protein [Aeromicrobium sp. 9AM]VXB44393.1 conserved hypothetical protein [Aeromicrobium sp. 9AM]
MNEDSLRKIDQVAAYLSERLDEDPERVANAIVQTVVEELGGFDVEIDSAIEAQVLMNAASVLVNAAERLSDVELLALGELWMTRSAGSEHLVGSPIEANARYNLANSQLCAADAHTLPAEGQAYDAAESVKARWEQRDRLRQIRSGFALAAELDEDGLTAGMALCNLANTLDHSGRWIEAYDAYVRALAADPTNGNAAGNAAVLIQRAISSGWDFEGHLCSLYDHYLALAKANRDRTVEVAGEHAAAKFDAMEPLGSDEPFRHDGQLDDDYQQWIVENRLALAASLEGLGTSTDEGRWDTATVRSVTTPVGQVDTPTIFSLINLLKADYLVARRLAFDAIQSIRLTGGWGQETHDSGVYADTLNYALYGTVSSSLVLAHRAALDMLDKTAVALNEHLELGDDPKYITFRRFWFQDPKHRTQIREDLLSLPGLQYATLSMAELAYDMVDEGIYAHAQEVRHAGTHRFVLVHHGLRDLESTGATQTISLKLMIETLTQALSVARAAFLYLISMIETVEGQKAADGRPTTPVEIPNVL